MDALDAAGPLGLLVLALVDSTSVGTFVIPLILLVTGTGGAWRVAVRTLAYLAMIGVFYLALGIALLAGLLPLVDHLGSLLASPPAAVALAGIGGFLLWWSFHIDPAAIRKRGGDPEASARRWTDRARRASGHPGALAALALVAGLLEAASMIPYLAAMGMIAESGIGFARGVLVLVGYCAVMVLPAAVLCGVRGLLGARADRLLQRVHETAVRHAAGAFAWAVGIIGVILLLHTAGPALGALGVGQAPAATIPGCPPPR